MLTCKSCGLALPDHARFCARCGARVVGGLPQVDTWVLIVLAVGVVVTAGAAVLYAGIAIEPGAASTTIDASTLRLSALLLAAGLAILCLLQSVAIAGLLRGREWGRIAATAACAMWSLTCIGAPVAILLLTSIWRRRGSLGVAARPTH